MERHRTIRFDGVIPRTQLDVGAAVGARHDQTRRDGGGVVAHEQRMPRNRRRLPVRVDQHHADVQDDQRLRARRARDGEGERRDDDGAKHHRIVAFAATRCQRRADRALDLAASGPYRLPGDPT